MNNLNFKADILPFLIATIGEWVGLFYWLHFLDRDNFILANIILWIGFGIERIAVILWLRTVYRPVEGLASPTSSPIKIILGIIAITLPELVIWAIWLALAEGMGYLLAGVVLAILMLAEHSVELALVKGKNPLSFVKHRPTLFFTAMEVLGAAAWLHFVRNDQALLGGALLLIGLSIERIIEGATLKPQETAPA